jgi:hypothetical protein
MIANAVTHTATMDIPQTGHVTDSNSTNSRRHNNATPTNEISAQRTAIL